MRGRTLERGASERLAAWLVTGPLGHLYSAVVDIAVLALRYGRWRAGRAVRGWLR